MVTHEPRPTNSAVRRRFCGSILNIGPIIDSPSAVTYFFKKKTCLVSNAWLVAWTLRVAFRVEVDGNVDLVHQRLHARGILCVDVCIDTRSIRVFDVRVDMVADVWVDLRMDMRMDVCASCLVLRAELCRNLVDLLLDRLQMCVDMRTGRELTGT